MAKTAFTSGASGLRGSAIIKHACNTTTSDNRDSIIVTLRSPFECIFADPRIKFIVLNFTYDVSYPEEKMKEDDFAESYAVNKTLFENFLTAIDNTAPKLENITLPSGRKYYNLHIELVPSPVQESSPRCYGPFESLYFR
ncbi:uncharacterized protein N7479_005791 [Penicillium vulpinum]|uniref:Uncharacterized protein n=1 Tax=Penicillium vulpinum TaxID=29845 RepID=A0A1V6SEG2_9EURO|nr:uncharacterized protein N7479_005791 [Penicillium vulpinum]KAJ5958641.1 hypothetical protein N7479_005791 [Penicillium vulpinum]OQE12114.1 hypothetical protein PENVUL_c001G08411 [Penicillium vulpinum]